MDESKSLTLHENDILPPVDGIPDLSEGAMITRYIMLTDPDFTEARQRVFGTPEALTIGNVATYFGIGRTKMTLLIKEWRSGKELQRQRDELMPVKKERSDLAMYQVIDIFPDILMNMANIARHGKGKTAVDAAAFVKSAVEEFYRQSDEQLDRATDFINERTG